jgi:diguanylate cyclase (GGDEF)-like protein
MQNSKSLVAPRILFGLTAATSIGLVPFALHHLLTLNWALAISVASLCVWHGTCAFYTWRNPHSQRAGPYVLFGSLVAVLWAVHRLGGMGIHWSYVLILGIFYLLPRRQAVIANLVATPLAIVLVAPHVTLPELSRIVAGLTLVSVFAYVFARHMELQKAELTRLVSVDPLTQVSNRRSLTTALQEAAYGLTRHGTPVALVILDIDHFKSINDRYGHDAGDRVLVNVASRLRERVRLSDTVFRFGGEEFVVLASQTDADGAACLADHLRRLVAELATPGGEPITVSCGVAQLRPGETTDGWLKRADTALYRAKREGRNQVVVDRTDAA